MDEQHDTHAANVNYTYEPLRPGEIRILKLHAGFRNDALECTLHHALYGDGLAGLAYGGYQALSYEWGKEVDIGRHILVNDLPHPRPLQRNLGRALLEIREEDADLRLWIDAICINQDNPDEKSHQVAMMGAIYREATNVIAWIGPATDSSDLAIQVIHDRSYDPRDPKPAEEGALASLFQRSYWRRMWVIQELHLARSYVVRCGSRLVNQKDIEDCMAWRNRHLSQSSRKGYGYYVHTLAWWLHVCFLYGLEATDERDYVYAVLGVSNDCKNGEIVPDYRGTVRSTLLQAARMHEGSERKVLFAQRYAKKMGLVFDEELEGVVRHLV